MNHQETRRISGDLIEQVRAEYQPTQMELEGVSKAPDIAAVVAGLELIQQTIDIPAFWVVPKGESVRVSSPEPWTFSPSNYQAPSEELWIQFLFGGHRWWVSAKGDRGGPAGRLCGQRRWTSTTLL